MPTLARIRESLRAYAPRQEDPFQPGLRLAAVAVILHERPGGGAEVLLIERALRDEDPWSGHMAFPGGRSSEADPDSRTTATRETLEEVGVRLLDPIGRLDDQVGVRHPEVPPMHVTPWVYELPERPALQTNHEVASALWVPLPHILDPASQVVYELSRESFRGRFAAFEYEGRTVWGLTYRILRNLFATLGRDLPELPAP